MVDELESWGHTGGAGGHIVFKGDNEDSICNKSMQGRSGASARLKGYG